MSQTKAQLISDLVQALNFTGTASAPANGAFLSAANTLALATNSAQRLTIKSDGGVAVGTTDLTTVGSPNKNFVVGSTTNAQEVATTLNVMEGTNNRRVKFFLDDDDGVFGIDSTASTGVAPFVIRMAQSEKLRIDQSGNVGINNTSPDRKLEVQNDGDYAAKFSGGSGAGHTSIEIGQVATNGSAGFNATGGSMLFDIAGTEKMRLNTSGQLGIGTSSPNRHLHLHQSDSTGATVRFTNSTTGSGENDGFTVGINGNEQAEFWQRENTAMVFGTNNTQRMAISASGLVGIGADSPAAELHVKETGTGTGTGGIISETASGGGNAGYAFRTNGTNRWSITTIGSAGSESLRFRDDQNSTERMRIDSSGRVLIGHTSSIASDGFNSALQVNGTGGDNSSIYQSRFSNNTSPPNFVLAKARSGNVGTNGVVQENDMLGNIQFHGNDGSGFHNGANIFAIVEAGVGNNDMPAALGFATNAGSTSTVTKMRLSGDGRLTAGAIDSSSTSVLHLRSNTSAETTLELSSVGNYNGSLPSGKISFTQQNVTEIARIKFETNTGAANRAHIAFWTNFGGLAERMRILDTGQIGIGNSIPSSFHSSGHNLVVGSGSGEEGMTIYSGNSSNGVINFADSTSGSDSYEGRIIYSHSSNHMTFNVGDGAERMRIVDGGRLFVGTNGAININSVTTGHTFNQVDDYKWILGLRCELTNKVGLAIRYAAGGNDHDVIIFVKDSTVKFVVHSTGNVNNANNSYGQTSDVSLKENIVDANSQWNDIKNVKVRNFNFKAETGLPSHTQIGVVAQEIETTSPKLVTENEEGIKEVGYSVLYMKAIKALQEAMTRIETLEAEVAALKAA